MGLKIFVAVILCSETCHALPQRNIIVQWDDAALQGIRDSKQGAPIVSRALAAVAGGTPLFSYF